MNKSEWDKPSFISPKDMCRTCKHEEYQHWDWVGKYKPCPIMPCQEILETKRDPSGQAIWVTKRCGCQNYLPLDNLKYLEQLSAKI